MATKRRRLAERRKAVGYTQEQLAEQLGVERTTVARWEAGDTVPQPWQRPNLATALRLSIDEVTELLVAPDGSALPQPTTMQAEPGGLIHAEDRMSQRELVEASDSRMVSDVYSPASGEERHDVRRRHFIQAFTGLALAAPPLARLEALRQGLGHAIGADREQWNNIATDYAYSFYTTPYDGKHSRLAGGISAG